MKRLEVWARNALKNWYQLPFATRQEEDAFAQGVARGIRLAKSDLESKLALAIADRDPELASAVVGFLRKYGEDEIRETHEESD